MQARENTRIDSITSPHGIHHIDLHAGHANSCLRSISIGTVRAFGDDDQLGTKFEPFGCTFVVAAFFAEPVEIFV
ncbi:hypothetical protein D9M69_680210 [compost metagenome]